MSHGDDSSSPMTRPHSWKTDPRCTAMSETELNHLIEQMAETSGFLHYHVLEQRKYAKRTSKGFPDWEFVHPTTGAHFYAEAKKQTGELSADQKVWISALVNAGNVVLVWRPEHWFRGDIQTIFEAFSNGRSVQFNGPIRKIPGPDGTGKLIDD